MPDAFYLRMDASFSWFIMDGAGMRVSSPQSRNLPTRHVSHSSLRFALASRRLQLPFSPTLSHTHSGLVPSPFQSSVPPFRRSAHRDAHFATGGAIVVGGCGHQLTQTGGVVDAPLLPLLTTACRAVD